jgi:eukaryotic-like serine/threonine-protein kinase
VPLSSGVRLGPYEVLSPLGAGGVGEVYRARDTRLGRDVAIKVLPESVAGDAHALARFEREARAVAALSHPNILALFDVGESNGVHFAVTELLEGETLRARVDRGPFPVRKALDVAVQITEALAAAHENGIVHRDLKPENVFLTPDGHVKLLDFGLARHDVSRRDAKDTRSPTLDALSERGVVVGTAAYMSPEQARGGAVDFRSDQFSLGVVLYEMLVGRRPFKGDSATELLASILRDDPEPLEKAAPNVPAPVRWIVERCLAKEAGERYESTRDLARDLATWRVHLSEATSPGLPGTGVATSPLSRRRALARAVAMLGIVAIVFGAGLLVDRWALPGRRAATILSPTFQRLTTFDGEENWPTLSPDGKTVAYQKTVGGKSDIFVLRVGGQNPTNLTASLEGDCGEPAFSPDGRFIAFRSEGGGGGIFLMGATGESARRLTDFGHTPAWFPDGRRIAVATEVTADPSSVNIISQLWIVDLASGARRQLPVVGTGHQPSVSPHGLRIAYWGIAPAGGRRDVYTIGTGDEGPGPSTPVTEDLALDWSPFWSGDGRFLYFGSDRGGTMNLWRVGIDESSGKVQGNPEPVMVPVSQAGPFRATPDGSRVVFTSVERERTLERLPFDPVSEKVTGAASPLMRFVTGVAYPRVSPQGNLLTFSGFEGHHILVMKTDGTGLRKLTDDGHNNRLPNFSPDGRKILFSSDRTGTYDAWVVDVDGSGLTPVTRSTNNRVVYAIWSPDGKTIAAQNLSGRLLLLPYPRSVNDPLPEPVAWAGDDRRMYPLSWSPDSKKVAGSIVRTDGSFGGIGVFDAVRRSYRCVTETGDCPSFLRDGQRIVFRDGNALKIVDTATGRIREILKGDPRRALSFFGLAPDDQSLFVFWVSVQADLWLMDLESKR